MAKSPRSAASSPATSPAAIVNPLQARRKKAPLCFQCQQKKAIHLPRIGQWRKWTVFCSFACAAMHAMRTVVESPYTWCLTHKRWTDRFGVCMACVRAQAASQGTPALLLGDLDQYEEEVPHE